MLVFKQLFLIAFAVMACVRTVFGSEGYDAKRYRELCPPPPGRDHHPDGVALKIAGKNYWL